jgi:ankyrin repeat protein
MNNLENLPAELKLEILLKINNFKELQNICTLKSYNEICKMHKSKIIANVFFNKYGKKNVLRNEKVLERFDDLKMVKELFRLGADSSNKALIKSAENGNLEIVKILVQNGANILAQDNEALRASSELGHLEVVKFLVQNGANIHADDIDRDFGSILGAAIMSRNVDLIKFLTGRGAYIGGNYSIDEAIRDTIYDDDVQMLEILYDIYNPDSNDFVDMVLAASKTGKLKVLEFLVKGDHISINTLNKAKKLAIQNNHPEVVHFLESI